MGIKINVTDTFFEVLPHCHLHHQVEIVFDVMKLIFYIHDVADVSACEFRAEFITLNLSIDYCIQSTNIHMIRV